MSDNQEKTCETCGRYHDCRYGSARWTCYTMEKWMPIEKKYCPHCGVELTKDELEDLRRR